MPLTGSTHAALWVIGEKNQRPSGPSHSRLRNPEGLTGRRRRYAPTSDPASGVGLGPLGLRPHDQLELIASPNTTFHTRTPKLMACVRRATRFDPLRRVEALRAGRYRLTPESTGLGGKRSMPSGKDGGRRRFPNTAIRSEVPAGQPSDFDQQMALDGLKPAAGPRIRLGRC